MIKISPHLNIDAHDRDEHFDLSSTSMPTSILIGDDDDDAWRDRRWWYKMQPSERSAMTDQDQQFIRERESVREKRKNKLKREEREKRIKKY